MPCLWSFHGYGWKTKWDSKKVCPRIPKRVLLFWPDTLILLFLSLYLAFALSAYAALYQLSPSVSVLILIPVLRLSLSLSLFFFPPPSLFLSGFPFISSWKLRLWFGCSPLTPRAPVSSTGSLCTQRSPIRRRYSLVIRRYWPVWELTHFWFSYATIKTEMRESCLCWH